MLVICSMTENRLFCKVAERTTERFAIDRKTAARFSLAAVPLPHSGDFFVVVGDFGVFVVPETLVAHAVKILLGVAEFEPV